MEEGGRDRYDARWQELNDQASAMKQKYTQGFDPNYLQHAAQRRQEAEEEIRQAQRARRSSSRRRRSLSRQQQLRLEKKENTRAEREEEYGSEYAELSARMQQRRGSRAARRQRKMRERQAILTCLAIGIVAVALLLANRKELTITMAGSDPLYLDLGELYTDPGATAAYQGKLFPFRDREVAVTSSNDIDTSKYGTYQIKYHAIYGKQEAVAIRTVLIRDKTPPEIRLDATSDVARNGQAWEDQFTAIDDQDGDVTAQVEVSGEVDTSRNGTYEIRYRVADASGNVATATREVLVSSYQINNPGLAKEDGSNVIYLTFDDGPGPYTEELLEILNLFNVKATFFVTDQWPEYRSLIKEEVQKGHVVGNHTATHEYATIYSSVDFFWNDFEAMSAIIENETGAAPTIMRFPGGSSNAIVQGWLIDELIQGMEQRRLTYYDWTITSGDSDVECTEDSIYEVVVASLEDEYKADCVMILCHDPVEECVIAMRKVIPWCLEHGYVFLPITEDTPVIHHELPA